MILDIDSNSAKNGSISKMFISCLEIGNFTLVINIRNTGQNKKKADTNRANHLSVVADERRRRLNRYSASILGAEFLPDAIDFDSDPPQAEFIRSVVSKLPYIASIR